LWLALLACIAFVSLGLPDALWGVAWPSASASLRVPVDALGMLLVASTSGYLVSSFTSGRLLARMSVGALLSLSCVATAISLIGYAVAPRWLIIVAFGVLAGLGAGAIDTGLNTYAATHFKPRMVNWLHGCYGVGATAGPLLMTLVLSRGLTWRVGYGIVGLWQIALATCFALTVRWWNDTGDKPESASHTAVALRSSTLRLRVAWLSMSVFFVYTGIEAAIGAWTYSLFTMSRNVDPVIAGTWVSFYWGSFTVGRFVSGALVARVPMNRFLQVCILCLGVGATLITLNLGNWLSLVAIVLMGFSAAPIFPSLISTTPQRLGIEHAANAIGFQIGAAVLGQSLLPAFFGVLAQRVGLEVIGPSLLGSAVILMLLFHATVSAGSRRSGELALPAGLN
jgi:fucose permease